MTKLEICRMEDANPGMVYLYPEGAFYKANQKSAWLLHGFASLVSSSQNATRFVTEQPVPYCK